jgi:hypothetical protein
MADLGCGHKSLFSAMYEDFEPRYDGESLQLGRGQLSDFEDVVWADVGAVAGAFAFVRVDDRSHDFGRLLAFD